MWTGRCGARQDRLYVKQFEEDTNLRCTLLVDVSNSMRYGNGALNKFEYACTIAASLAYLILRQSDAASCVAFDRTIRRQVPFRTKRTHLNSIIEALSVSEPEDKTELASVLRGVAESFPRRGLMVLISDLLVDPQPTLKGLRLLRPARTRCHCVSRFGRRRSRFSFQWLDAFRRAGVS